MVAMDFEGHIDRKALAAGFGKNGMNKYSFEGTFHACPAGLLLNVLCDRWNKNRKRLHIIH